MRLPAAVILISLSLVATAAADTPKYRYLSVAGPSARDAHATAATGDRYVWVHGGRARTNDMSLDDLWRLDVKRERWKKIRVQGPKPEARFGHNLVAANDGTLLLYGGQQGASFFGDAWRFDPNTKTWTELAGSAPARYGAGGAYEERSGTFYITHGFTDAGRFDDTWQVAPFVDSSSAAVRPLKRCVLGAGAYRGRLYIFGGQSNEDPYLGDLWRLDLSSRRWKELEPDVLPSERNFYAYAQSGRNWYLQGGRNDRGGSEHGLHDLWRLDMRTGTFKRIRTRNAPPPRWGHGAAIAGDTLVLTGGRTATGDVLAETWLLEL